MRSKEWFETWFASPFYDVLYAHRDEQEAEEFVETLARELPLKAEARILDLACGNGRHARAFAKKGWNVIGIDITERFIEQAREKSQGLPVRFFVGDIRSFSFPDKFDLIFNGFTSFGYFKNLDENLQVLRKVYEHLNQGGFFVLDYLNSEKVRSKIQEKIQEEKELPEYKIFIIKTIEGDFVYKRIKILRKDTGEIVGNYQERVRLFSYEELKFLLESVGLEVLKVWGDYTGKTYYKNSDRMIFISHKTSKSE